jgi:RND family efflux transporter MFP subunit
MKYSIPILITLISTIISCRTGNTENNVLPSSKTFTVAVNDDRQKVKVLVLKQADFKKEILSNGKLYAVKKAELKFRTTGIVSAIYVKNGDRVVKDQVIARLDSFALVNNLKQSRNRFERTMIDIQDVLLSQGYIFNDSARIPKRTMRTARIRSGYDEAKANLEMAEYELNASVLRAPFSGVVADLTLKESNFLGQAEVFCTIIDNTWFEARFPVLENELTSVRLGQAVRVIPYSSNNVILNGEIIMINPRVDQDGMVSVGAICRNTGNMLIEGMNVKIIIEESLPGKLVVPKQAVVIRSEKQVVFKYSEGRAKWVYVTTGEENSSSIEITEGLSTGDSIIYSGSLSLVHDSRVEIEN